MFLFILLAWFSLSIFVVQVPFFYRALTGGDRGRPRVALTFDDGPHPKFTPMVLDVLKEYNVRATFFLVGEKVIENPDTVKRIVGEGHCIGNHSMSHVHLLGLMRTARQMKEIEGCRRAITDTAGTSFPWYRPPMGYKTPSTFWAAKRLGLAVVGWHIKGWDTFYTDPEKIASSVLKRVRNGSIILLHDSSTLRERPIDRSPTVDALPDILSGLKERGLRPVTLDGLFDTGEEK
ncbi:MAG: polysaccharide deacetylase family protein [Deltaproteobacteria bacterium]|uniref:Polysaccharide deacetylase family protein n=1 Tax=Candidatus Zymogenus saltonus TaxID=2844893 RepID=A0A9D8PMV5_9DELT|nr:polysaccharide deacetylase family protein [Candidatus Zymogenus saltonus]